MGMKLIKGNYLYIFCSKTRRIKSPNNSNSKNKFKSYLPSKDVVKEFSKIVQNKLNRIRNATPLRDKLNIN